MASSGLSRRQILSASVLIGSSAAIDGAKARSISGEVPWQEGEVVEDSTSKLPDADLHAIAVYLKDTEGGSSVAPPPLAMGDPKMKAGAAIFADSCSGCHQADGKGVPRMFPPLTHNANVQQGDPSTVIRVILQGARTAPTDARPTPFAMPAFDWKLKDDEVAAVASYVRNAWGNAAPAVTADQVHTMHDRLKQVRAQGGS